MMSRCFLVAVVIMAMLAQLSLAISQTNINAILKKHNQYRAKHRAPALKWDKTVAQYAQKWTNRCVFQHSGSSQYGENIAMGYGSWNQVVAGWYNEVKDYDYSNPGFSGSTGHFTQVVWKGTTKIGCGFSNCGGKKIYSCNYKKPGNYQGEFPQNVLPPKKSS
ncbi:CAP domain-containing protein [Chlamydoabsidia padenii]|nr:CAP domain-containing protein [Chlamydoabsidia padenii]